MQRWICVKTKALLLLLFDVLIENFQPGTLARWGLDTKTLWQANPKLVVLRTTAFGQTDPYISQPCFARIFEAMGGLTHFTGNADSPPMHSGYPLADAFGGVFGAMSILAALFKVVKTQPQKGEEIDLSLTEATFRLLDFLAIEYDQLGMVRGRSDNRNQYSAPSNVFMTSDKRYVSLSGSTDTTFRGNCTAIGSPDLADDPKYASNALRVGNSDDLERLFGAFIAGHTLKEVLTAFAKAKGTVAPVCAVDQIFEDPQYKAREAIISIPDDDFGTVRVQGVVPKFMQTPGHVRWTGKDLGADNSDFYENLLGLSANELADYKRRGVI